MIYHNKNLEEGTIKEAEEEMTKSNISNSPAFRL